MSIKPWVGLAVAGTLVALALSRSTDQQATAWSREELAAAVGALRPVVGRVAGLTYHPHDGETADAALLRVLLQRPLSPHTGTGPPDAGDGVEALATRALLQTVSGELDGAAADLETALRLQPGQTRLLNDLAAVDLQRGLDEPGRSDLLVRALERIEEAVRVAPKTPEAVFNQALCRQALGLDAAAAEAWRRFLELDADPASGWSREAAHNLKELRPRRIDEEWAGMRRRLEATGRGMDGGELLRAAYRRFPRRLRLYAEQDLLGRWAQRLEAGDSLAAERVLALAERIAVLLAEERGDLLLRDATRSLRRAAASSDRRRLAQLTTGVNAYAAGVASLDTQGADGRALLQRARSRLETTDSPLLGWVDLHLSIVDFYDGDHRTGLRRLEPWPDRSEERGHLSLAARGWHILGIHHLQLSEYSRAIACFRRSRDLSERLGENEQVAHQEKNLALTYRHLGESGEAWRHLIRALGLRDDVVEARRLYSLMRDGGEIALHSGHPRSALLFFDAAHRAAGRWGSAASVAEALSWRARTLERLGESDASVADLDRAERWATRIETPDLRRRIEADCRMVRGESLATRHPAAAIPLLGSAFEDYRQTDFQDHQAEILERLAASHLEIGEAAAGERHLEMAIQLYEARRRQVTESALRIAYFDRAVEAFDAMVRLQLDLHDHPLRALDYVERSRARELLDAVAAGNGGTGAGTAAALARPVGAEQILQRLPPDIALVELAVLPDRLAVWVLLRGESEHFTVELPAEELSALVEQVRAVVPHSGSPAAQTLSQSVLEPALRDVPSGVGVVLVPDKSLHRLPFAVLPHPRTGRPLLEEHALVVAPSASLFLRAFEEEHRRGWQGTAVAFGDPAFDRSAHPTLAPLGAARREAVRVGALYPGSEVRTGEAASTEELLLLAPRAGIVHLATHAVAYPDAPWRSQLVLAGPQGALRLSEIQRLRWPRTHLVALAACDTASGRIWRNEGPVALARGFLATGIPTVVASLWPLEDRASGELFLIFHRHLAAGAAPARALQQAQLELLDSDDSALSSPRVWAGLQVFGSGFVGSEQGAENPLVVSIQKGRE